MQVPIKDYEGLYEISDDGRVWSVRKNLWLRTGTNNNKGYLHVVLYKCGTERTCDVHRLVAEAFIPNPDNLPQVNHKDEDKANNCVENLEWCNRKYNMNYGTCRERASVHMLATKYKNGTCDDRSKDIEYNRNYQKLIQRKYRAIRWTNGVETLPFSTLMHRRDAFGKRYCKSTLKRDGWHIIEL